jgi:hypothetical protein
MHHVVIRSSFTCRVVSEQETANGLLLEVTASLSPTFPVLFWRELRVKGRGWITEGKVEVQSLQLFPGSLHR